MNLTRSELTSIQQAVNGGTYILTPQLWERIEATIREGVITTPDAYDLDEWAREAFARNDTTTSLAEALMCVMETNVDITIQLADYPDKRHGTVKRAVVFAGEPSPYDKDVLHEGPMDEEAMATAIMLHLWRELHD